MRLKLTAKCGPFTAKREENARVVQAKHFHVELLLVAGSEKKRRTAL